ncbi:MAG: zinc-dependent metalloprotease, partial [Nostocoides sp.]
QLDPAMLTMVGAQVREMFAAPFDGPVSQTTATDLARRTVALGGDPSVSTSQQKAVADALGVARLWLDGVTSFAAHDLTGSAWSRAEWIEATMPLWIELVSPVAAGVSGAVGAAMQAQFGRLGDLPLPEGVLPPGVDPAAAMAPMMDKMSSAMFSMQLGQAVGALAGEVVSGTEVALPLVPSPQVAMIPANVDAFAEGLDVPIEEVRLYLALRESARTRLFGAVPWLAAGVMAAVRDYAGDITIDTDAIEASLAGADLSDPAALQSALQDNLFTPEQSPAQRAALSRLETLLALVEGWVDVVTERATAGKLPHADALGEAVRRRRATGGPAEKTFSSLVGLELRPRRLRDAANLFKALEDRLGAEGRDAAWRHPDLAPSAADLDDIIGYVDRAAAGDTPDDMDAALDALLRGDDPGDGPTP